MQCRELEYDLIVVGAGLIGSAFALQIAGRTEMQIAVVERAAAISKNDQANQRVVALGEAATDLLREVGVFTALEAGSCYPYSKMFIWDECSDGELLFDARDYDKKRLGHLVDSQQCTLLTQEALEHVDNIDVYYQFSANSLDFHEHRASITADNLSLNAKLIVAADGSHSWVRQQAKISVAVEDYLQRGIVAKISTEFSHQDTAWQRFLRSGPLAVLPLSNNHSCIVWSADNERADQLMKLSDTEFELAIAEALENRLGAIQLLSTRLAFPLQSQQAETYFKRRLALISDAGHSIHPLAGQGANLGFKDAAALSMVLEQELLSRNETATIGDLQVLQRYQRLRRLDNVQTDMMMSALHQIFKSTSPWLLLARGMGMKWVGDSLPIKQFLAKRAMGI